MVKKGAALVSHFLITWVSCRGATLFFLWAISLILGWLLTLFIDYLINFSHFLPVFSGLINPSKKEAIFWGGNQSVAENLIRYWLPFFNVIIRNFGWKTQKVLFFIIRVSTYVVGDDVLIWSLLIPSNCIDLKRIDSSPSFLLKKKQDWNWRSMTEPNWG